MITIPELRHNRFVEVDIPKPSALFARTGGRLGSKYSGDENLQDLDKIHTAANVMAEAAKIAQETPDSELGIKPDKPE